MIKTMLKDTLKPAAFILLLETAVVGLLYQLNQTYGELYGAIQVIDKVKIWQSIGIFSGIAFILVGLNGWLVALVNRLAFKMRSNLVEAYIKVPENRDVALYGQKVQEDTRRFTESICELTIAIYKAALKLPLFLYVILSLTNITTSAIVLTLVVSGTILTKLMARRLVTLQSAQESREAEFRDSLAHSVTGTGMASFASNVGVPHLRFHDIRMNFMEVNQRLKMLAFTQQGLGQGFVLVPFIVLMPLYISKTITMGAFFQAVNALGKVIDSLTVLIDSRQIIISCETSYGRLKTLKVSSDK